MSGGIRPVLQEFRKGRADAHRLQHELTAFRHDIHFRTDIKAEFVGEACRNADRQARSPSVDF